MNKAIDSIDRALTFLEGMGGVYTDALNARNHIAIMEREMKRYLPVIERLEERPMAWIAITDGLGIATSNGYKEALRKMEEGDGG